MELKGVIPEIGDPEWTKDNTQITEKEIHTHISLRPARKSWWIRYGPCCQTEIGWIILY